MDLPQLVQRVMFAGGQAAAVCLGQIQLFVGICLAGEKIRLCQQRRVEQRIVPGIAGSKAVPDPQLRLRQQAMKDPRCCRQAAWRAASLACGDQCQTKRQLLSVAGGKWLAASCRKRCSRSLRVVTPVCRITCQPISASQLKNLLQVVPAGVAGHLRIVPAGAEQPTAEKGIVDIDGDTGRAWCSCSSSRRTSSRSRSSSSRTVTTIRVWRSATGRAGRSRRLISRVCGGLIGRGDFPGRVVPAH